MKGLNFFTSCYLRVYFCYHGNFNNFHKSPYFDYFKKLADKEIVPLQEILYRALGYESDCNLTSQKRFELRKEISMNIDNQEFWKSKYKPLGVERTSQVVDYYSSLNVIGLGTEFSSVKLNNRSYKGFDLFLENEKEMVDIFCKAASIIVSNIYSDGNPLTVEDLIPYFDVESKEAYDECKQKLGITAKDVFVLNFINRDMIYVENSIMYVPKKKLEIYSKEFLQESLFYAYLNRSNIIPINHAMYYDKIVKYLPKLFTISDVLFQYLVDLSHMTRLSIREIYRMEGLDLPDPDEMLKLSHGVFLPLDGCIDYVPEDVKGKITKAVPCRITDSTFLEIVNKKLYKDIVYQRGVPYYGTQPLYMVTEGD